MANFYEFSCCYNTHNRYYFLIIVNIEDIIDGSNESLIVCIVTLSSCELVFCFNFVSLRSPEK